LDLSDSYLVPDPVPDPVPGPPSDSIFNLILHLIPSSI
jgi:hypothetical protein